MTTPNLGDREVRNCVKLRYELMPAVIIRAYTTIATLGAIKYAPWNWAKGLMFDETYGSTMRHLQAWWGGQDLDEDYTDENGTLIKGTGKPHLWHILWNVGALIFFTDRGRTELDNRPHIALAAPVPVGEYSEDGYGVEVMLPDSTGGGEWMPTSKVYSTLEHARAIVQDLRDNMYADGRMMRILKLESHEMSDGSTDEHHVVVQTIFPGDDPTSDISGS